MSLLSLCEFVSRVHLCFFCFFFFKQKTAYEMRISDWSSDVCSSDLVGLSARGIALAPGAPGPEEFPDFTNYWFEPARSEDEPVTVYALLDGPSVAGVYRFLLRRTSGVVMDIEASVHPRRTIERLGLAPLTSIYWFSETAKPTMENG